MVDLAQQIYLGQLAQQQAGIPMRGMMSPPQQGMMPQGSSPYDMQAINQVRQAMGAGPGHKPVTPGFMDMLGVLGNYLGTRSKNAEFAQASDHRLANFAPTIKAREQERLALNQQIMESLRHAARDQEDRAYRHASLGETIRQHNLSREEHDLMRDLSKSEKEAARLERAESRIETERHHKAQEEDRKLRHEEMGAQNAHLNKKEIDGAKETLKIGKEAKIGLANVNKMIEFYKDKPAIGFKRYNPENQQTLNALRKGLLVSEIKKLPAKGQNKQLQQQINAAIPGATWSQTAALEALEDKKLELEAQIQEAKEAQELIESFKMGKKSTVQFVDKNGNPFNMVNATPEDIEAAEASGEFKRVS
jgi:hypothetical protein